MKGTTSSNRKNAVESAAAIGVSNKERSCLGFPRQLLKKKGKLLAFYGSSSIQAVIAAFYACGLD